MTKLDLAHLAEVAEGATPGPWLSEVSVYSDGSFDAHWAVRTVEKLPDHPWSPRFIAWMNGSLRSDLHLRDIEGATYCRECSSWHLGRREIGVDVRADSKAGADATYIATFDPPTVLALLDRLREAEEALRPFAKIGPSCFYPEDGSEAEVYTAVLWDGVALQDFTGADIARARAYFTPQPPSLPGRGEEP